METLYEEISSLTDLISNVYELEQTDVIKDVDYKELVYNIQNQLIAALYNYNINKKDTKCIQTESTENQTS